MLDKEIKNLESIHDKILDFGDLVITINENIYELLENKEIDALKSALDTNLENIQKMADDIDNEVIKVISLYSPSAIDLRELIAFLKISNELVRVFTNSCTFVKKFPQSFKAELKQKKIIKFVLPMQESSLNALRHALSMVTLDDKEQVKHVFTQVYTEENQTDDLYVLVEKEIMKLSTSNIELSIEYLEVLSAIRRIEKVADRALNIASLLHYAKVGGKINHIFTTDKC